MDNGIFCSNEFRSVDATTHALDKGYSESTEEREGETCIKRAPGPVPYVSLLAGSFLVVELDSR